MNKILKIVNVFFVALLLLVPSYVKNVRSAESPDYFIERIDVDGTTVFEGDLNRVSRDTVNLERGETLTVEVWVRGVEDIGDNNLSGDTVDNVKVKAFMSGGEFDDVEDTSDVFTVREGVLHKKVLRLDIPEDFDIEDETTTLNIEVFDGDNSREEDLELNIVEKRHALNILDVILNPGLTVESGKTVFGTVRVENLGEKTERDVKIVMSIPELGLSTRTFIDELVNEEDAENDDEDDKVSASSDELFLKIPEDTKEGTYTLKFDVVYNRGHSSLTKTYALNVKGIAPTLVKEQAIASVDTTLQTVEAGKGAIFKVMVTNLGTKTMTFSTDVAGVTSWGNSRVDPASVTVAPDQTGEMFVFIGANENAQAADNAVTLTVKSGENIVKQVPVTVKVSGAQTQDTFGSLRRGLEIGFIVLLIVLVILGLILAARKLGGKEEEEGKTYY
ncbi:hypothetical protein HYX18_04525 [Candidatus Woesearchaeota archaeon]|nr:hypothetical protein [Candidatus Woesearchaeota archaeon]